MTVNRIRTATRLFPVAALATLLASTALAADWPTFKPGNWTFDRTITGMDPAPKKVSITECIDPTADQKSQQARLGKAGCKFTPLTQNGKTYRYSAACSMAGMKTQSDSVLEVESAEAYTITVDSVVDGQKTHEVLRARRIGDCAK
jgi:opacity protein-like surface antigen